MLSYVYKYCIHGEHVKVMCSIYDHGGEVYLALMSWESRRAGVSGKQGHSKILCCARQW